MKLSDLKNMSGLLQKPQVNVGVPKTPVNLPNQNVCCNALVKPQEAEEIMDALFARHLTPQQIELLSHKSPFEKANALTTILSREAVFDILDLEKITGKVIRVANGIPLNNVSRTFWIDPSTLFKSVLTRTSNTYTYNPVEVIFGADGNLVSPTPADASKWMGITTEIPVLGFASVVNRFDSENGNTRIGLGIKEQDRFVFQISDVNKSMKIFQFVTAPSTTISDVQKWEAAEPTMYYGENVTNLPDSDELSVSETTLIVTGTNVRAIVYPIVLTDLVKEAILEAIFADDLDGFSEKVIQSY